MAKTQTKSLADELEEAGKASRRHSCLYSRLSDEERRECDEVIDRYIEGRLGSVSIVKIADRLSAHFNKKFTRAIVNDMIIRRRGVKSL